MSQPTPSNDDSFRPLTLGERLWLVPIVFKLRECIYHVEWASAHSIDSVRSRCWHLSWNTGEVLGLVCQRSLNALHLQS